MTLPSRRWTITLLAAALVGCATHAAGDASSLTSPAAVLASITVTLSAEPLLVGQQATATATAFDQRGQPIATGSVVWASADPTVASVSPSGVVRAVSLGSTTITAAAADHLGQAPLTVAATLVASQIDLRAGEAAALLASPAIDATLDVVAGAQYLLAVVNTDQSSSVHEDFTLVGASAASAAANALQLAAPAAAGGARAAAPVPERAVAGQALPVAPVGDAALANHVALLETNRRLYASFATSAARDAERARATAGSAGAARMPTISPTIGTVNKVYVRNTLAGSCSSVDSIGARTVAVSAHFLVLADTNGAKWPQIDRPDTAFYQNFVNELEGVTYPHLLQYVGDPLLYDASLSNLGRVTIVLTPVLNNLPGITGGGSVAGFVSPCDLHPFVGSGANLNRSNFTEVVYSDVPASSGATIISWAKYLRGVSAHELEHVVSMASRTAAGSPSLEETWLEEGLAQVSSEVWERHFNLAAFRGNAGFGQTVVCEIYFGVQQPCDIGDDKPYNLAGNHLQYLFQYLQKESTTHGEGLGIDTPANYGAGWAFSRWAIDQYAGTDEAGFVRGLVRERELTGLSNLAAHTGQSAATLLVYWNLASAVFEAPVPIAEPRATIPSFNLADIFSTGQRTRFTCAGAACGLFTAGGTPLYPVQPNPVAAGSFASTMTGVPGTSAVFYLLTAGASGAQSLRLRSSSGSALPSSSGLRLAILRVR